jgi:hypothetical protein
MANGLVQTGLDAAINPDMTAGELATDFSLNFGVGALLGGLQARGLLGTQRAPTAEAPGFSKIMEPSSEIAEGYGQAASLAAKAQGPKGPGIGAAPNQVTPGIREQNGVYFSPNRTQPERWRATYDQYGRQIGRTDYTNQPDPMTHADPHYHLRIYGPGYGPKGFESGPFPGEH